MQSLSLSMMLQGMVEKWLLQVQETMILSLQDVMKESVVAYNEKPRNKWVLEWPGQVVIAASTIYWTRDVNDAIEHGTLQVKIRLIIMKLRI